VHTTYLIGFQVRPGQRERFLELLNALLDAMRHEKTFLNATLHRDGENENRFLLHETWSDHQDVLDVQIHRPLSSGMARCIARASGCATGYFHLASNAGRSFRVRPFKTPTVRKSSC
jgi:quinol monooxygenase YgiN